MYRATGLVGRSEDRAFAQLPLPASPSRRLLRTGCEREPGRASALGGPRTEPQNAAAALARDALPQDVVEHLVHLRAVKRQERVSEEKLRTYPRICRARTLISLLAEVS